MVINLDPFLEELTDFIFNHTTGFKNEDELPIFLVSSGYGSVLQRMIDKLKEENAALNQEYYKKRLSLDAEQEKMCRERIKTMENFLNKTIAYKDKLDKEYAEFLNFSLNP